MAGHAEQSNPLSSDIHKPLTNTQVYPGWETGREHDYWIPAADIDGEIPQQLRGTLLRNGPGISEVYGNKLVQRKLYRIVLKLMISSCGEAKQN